MDDDKRVFLDGSTLSPKDLVEIRSGAVKLGIADSALKKVAAARRLVESRLEQHTVSYGINTGFGNFASVIIPPESLRELQHNLITSHATGVGPYLDIPRTRGLLALRINILAKGYSGIRPEILQMLVEMFNLDCLPVVPCQGSVGASGDLAPLSHIALGLLGQGRMWNVVDETVHDAETILSNAGLKPIILEAKEGLCLINGTQFITSLAAEAVVRSHNLVRTSDIVACMTMESLKSSVRPFSSDVHRVRGHKGQQVVASRIRHLLHSDHYKSSIFLSHQSSSCTKVQDCYSIRCVPQVHGIVNDTLDFVAGVIETEMNAATDNPLVFTELNDVISGGNFHGEYPAKVCDYLAIAVHELANISERRTERLTNRSLSGLPAFLVDNGGLNSGFMIAHCTSAALTSENKTLVHPASSDTISTSGSQEDHVSMGAWGARKLLQVVTNVEIVVAIELLCACQAIDFLRPLTSTKPLEAVHALVRKHVPFYDKDRYLKPDIDAVVELVKSGQVLETVKPFLNKSQLPLWNF